LDFWLDCSPTYGADTLSLFTYSIVSRSFLIYTDQYY